MRSTQPRVFLVAYTTIDQPELCLYLYEVGADVWQTDAHSPAEALAEVAGRLCYRSWRPGLNANVTKVREGNATYLANIIAQKHGAVLEHSSVSFIFHHVSRVFTHELVRHRVGVAISQESLRYVRLTDINFWMPGAFSEAPEVRTMGRMVVEQLEQFQWYLAEKFGLDDPSADFPLKKKITSAMRRFAPLGLATSILWTTNMRNLRHVLEQRTALAAEEEMRLVFDNVGHIVQARFPAIFGDFVRTTEGEWQPGTSKV